MNNDKNDDILVRFDEKRFMEIFEEDDYDIINYEDLLIESLMREFSGLIHKLKKYEDEQ